MGNLGNRTPQPAPPHKTDGGAARADEDVRGGGRRATHAPVLPTPDVGETPPESPALRRSDRLSEWTQDRRDAWREWLTAQLLAAGYASPRRGKIAYWITDLSRATGIHKNTLLNYVRLGTQPGPEYLGPIARALGLHPLTVAYRAGLLTKDELIQLVGGGSIPSPDEMRAALAELDYLPESMAQTRAVLRATTQYTLDMVETLSRQLGLSPEEFGPVAAEVVKREIIADQTPFTSPHPADDLSRPQPGQQAGQQRLEHHPGPTRKRRAAPGLPGGEDPDTEL